MDKKNFFIVIFLCIIYVWLPGFLRAQSVINLNPEDKKLLVNSFSCNDSEIFLPQPVPLFSFILDGKIFYSTDAEINFSGKRISFDFGNGISGELFLNEKFDRCWKAVLQLENHTNDTVILENIVPFGESPEYIYITGTGPWSLARTKLFRPGLDPVGIILPDNAWEMGYASVEVNDTISLCAIARRTSWDKAARRRYKTFVYPGGFVEYTFWADSFLGEWQNGMKLMFQKRWLFDLEKFDNTLFERNDLAWIRSKYLMVLQMAWDHNFYDPLIGEYNFTGFLEEGKKYMGGYDIFGIWPSWPRLGVDMRNQWDLYAGLPGGLEKLKELATDARENGTYFFVAFNPWDLSTRKENPYKGMAGLIEAIGADGVVLDTRGKSSIELQRAADSVRSGVVMYSEGMAIPKDMPGIISGRVHDAIYMPPPLNLNKLIKPDFAIFRVCQLSQGRIHREAAISLFNGYGVELNTFAPGRPEWMKEEYLYLGKIVKILRENSKAFNSYEWTPLLPTLKDSIWVNEFPTTEKTIYTIFSLIPEGFNAPLFEAKPEEHFHFVSIWNHEELKPDTLNGKIYLPAKTASFDKSWIGTRREGNIDCIAKFPELLEISLRGDSLFILADKGSKIVITAGNPTYQSKKTELAAGRHSVKLYDLFGRYEGKFVVQLFDNTELLDEKIVYIKPGNPRLISKVIKTTGAENIPKSMVKIPAGNFIFYSTNRDQFIPYPKNSDSCLISFNDFYIDKYPVTNKDFYEFLKKSNYQPDDTLNFLKHWKNGKYPDGEDSHPVVYISLDDAKSYCRFAGKRLPTEAEWQYAAQGSDGRDWPWGKDFDSSKCNDALNHPTPVDAFSEGASPFGVRDMTGNVWQLTNDLYDDGSYYFVIMKGGSFYKPTSSWWYVQGGPQPVTHRQMLLLVSPGFDRNATVGFRCVKDVD